MKKGLNTGREYRRRWKAEHWKGGSCTVYIHSTEEGSTGESGRLSRGKGVYYTIHAVSCTVQRKEVQEKVEGFPCEEITQNRGGAYRRRWKVVPRMEVKEKLVGFAWERSTVQYRGREYRKRLYRGRK